MKWIIEFNINLPVGGGIKTNYLDGKTNDVTVINALG